MPEIIVSALITGPLTAVLTYWLSENRRQRAALSRDRRSSITGRWSGRLLQEVGKAVLESGDNVELQLKCGWRTVWGTGLLRIKEGETYKSIEFNLRGGFLYDRFLRLEYKNKKGHILQFGSTVLELSPQSDRLDGHYVGYGSISEMVIWGTLDLRHVD